MMRRLATACREALVQRARTLRASSVRPGAVLSLLLWLVLFVFHGWVFARRLADGSLLQTDVALRWAASLVLVAAFVALIRRGAPVLRGRRALVLWLLVVLVHAGVAMPVTPAGDVMTELPLGAFGLVALPALLGVDLLAVLALVFVALLAARTTPRLGAASRRLVPCVARLPGDYPPVFRRPPPVR